MIIREMSRQECLELLAAGRLGHLGCSRDGQPYVVPVHYAFANNSLFSFSVPGQKVEWMRDNPKVCFQVQVRDENRGWRSVVVNGVFEELPDRIGSKIERDHAWSLLERHANWWEPGSLKPMNEALPGGAVFYRIRIESLTGRQSIDEK